MARRTSRVPRPLRPLVGSAVLVGAVRAIDAIWTRAAGRKPPLPSSDAVATDDGTPAAVRDRLLYALLLGGALRLARRAGLRDDDPSQDW